MLFDGLLRELDGLQRGGREELTLAHVEQLADILHVAEQLGVNVELQLLQLELLGSLRVSEEVIHQAVVATFVKLVESFMLDEGIKVHIGSN